VKTYVALQGALENKLLSHDDLSASSRCSEDRWKEGRAVSSKGGNCRGSSEELGKIRNFCAAENRVDSVARGSVGRWGRVWSIGKL